MSECSTVNVTGLDGAGTVEVTSVDGSHVVEVDSVCPVGVIEVPTVCGPSIVEVDSRQPGPPGPANSLSIGTVETLPPDEPATATITGTPPSQVLSLGIPQGAEGDGLPVVTDIADLDTITETSVVLLDDPDGAGALLGLPPSAVVPGPVLVTSLAVEIAPSTVAVYQGIDLSSGTYQRLVLNGAELQGWAITRLPRPIRAGDSLISTGAGSTFEWDTVAATSADTVGAIIRRDSGGRARVRAPIDPLDIANKAYVDATTGTTGWRDCTTTDIVTGGGSTIAPATGRYLLARDGNLVHMQLESLAPVSATSAWPRIPSGFWPRSGSSITVAIWDDTTGDQILMRSSGNQWANVLGGRPLTAGSPRSATLSWRTSQNFPSTLPGVPA